MNIGMSVGFTGRSSDPTEEQLVWLRDELASLYQKGYREFHHGDCIGADYESHRIAHGLRYRIVVHPPSDHKKRAWCRGDEMRVPKTYRERNYAIVDESRILLALPARPEFNAEGNYSDRSGEWMTVRYARRVGVPVRLRLPQESANEE